MRLHPVAVMIALLLGASLGGIFGMLLAVPMMGVAKIMFVHLYETRVLGNWDYYRGPAGEGLVKELGEESEFGPSAPAAAADAERQPTADAGRPATLPPAKAATTKKSAAPAKAATTKKPAAPAKAATAKKPAAPAK